MLAKGAGPALESDPLGRDEAALAGSVGLVAGVTVAQALNRAAAVALRASLTKGGVCIMNRPVVPAVSAHPYET